MAKVKSQKLLKEDLERAAKLVRVGGIYSHYKNPLNQYKVVSVAVQEATEKICVIYQALYGEKLLFVRDLDIWVENVVVHGKKMARFKFVKT